MNLSFVSTLLPLISVISSKFDVTALNMTGAGSREMTELSKAFTNLLEELSSILRTHTGQLTTPSNSSSREI